MDIALFLGGCVAGAGAVIVARRARSAFAAWQIAQEIAGRRLAETPPPRPPVVRTTFWHPV